MADELSELYQDFLTGSYDCVDRIILNGNFSVTQRAVFGRGGAGCTMALSKNWTTRI